MSEPRFLKIKRGIAIALDHHFPDSDIETRRSKVNDLGIYFSIALANQMVDRSKINPRADIRDLDRALKHLVRAEKLIGSIGWHGGEALKPFAENRAKGNVPRVKGYQKRPPLRVHAPSMFSDAIRDLRLDIEKASEKIDPEDIAPIDPLQSHQSTGRPRAIQAMESARACAIVYQDLTGKRPARRIQWDTGSAYGPFHDFVEDIFRVLELSESAEHAIHAAMKTLS